MTKQERLQNTWHHFDDEREHLPCSARQACEWAVAEGILELPEIDPYDVLADEMSQALRAEHATDAKGRRCRVNHAVRVSNSGVQYTFWGVMGVRFTRPHGEIFWPTPGTNHRRLPFVKN